MNDKLNVVVRTIEQAWIALVCTSIVLFLIVLSFTFSGWLLLGFDTDDFKDPLSALSYLFRLLNDDLSFDPIWNESRIAFPIVCCYFIGT